MTSPTTYSTLCLLAITYASILLISITPALLCLQVATSTIRTIRKFGLDATAKKYNVDLSTFRCLHPAEDDEMEDEMGQPK